MAVAISKDGTAIDYQTFGSGPLVIFVAGALQHRAVDPESPKIAALLADSFTSLLYDRRGRGESANTEPYAIDREIEDIEALIDAIGGPAMLYGLSSGAVLALEAASALTGKVVRVVGYEPPIDINRSKDDALAELAMMEGFKSAHDGAGALAAFMASLGASETDVAQFRAGPQWAGFASAGTTLAHDYRIVTAATTGDMGARWRALTQPVLIVDGAQSWPMMAKGADDVAAALFDAQRQTLAGQTHEVTAEAIAPVLRVFFSKGKGR